ncbi:MAG: hypothetical protein HC836_30335 [Richelia sp. RM2_1_2]|nr:hypothetical protein [Richelia sp. RM2_1_2]
MTISKSNKFVLKYSQSFSAIRVVGTELFPIWLHVNAELLGNVAISDVEFQLGIAKMDYWFVNVIHNSVMFSSGNDWAMDCLLEMPANLPFIAPYEPTDDVLAILFNCKCNALSNGAFLVGYFTVEDENNNISYMYADEDMPDLPLPDEWFGGKKSYYEVPWWHRNDSSTFDITPSETDDLSKKPECFFSLDFLRERFNVSAEIIKPQFTPKVIAGKKGK